MEEQIGPKPRPSSNTHLEVFLLRPHELQDSGNGSSNETGGPGPSILHGLPCQLGKEGPGCTSGNAVLKGSCIDWDALEKL